jgi:hypothetical protein
VLPDHVQITNLIHTYPELIDSGDFTGVGELFAHGRITVADTGVVYSGAREVAAMYEEWVQVYADNGTPHTRHVTSNLVIEIAADGLSAKARSYVTVFQSAESFPLQPIFSNRYLDEFVKVGSVWRFRHRQMTEAYVGDTSSHLRRVFPSRAAGT